MATESEYKARIKQLMAENNQLKDDAKRNADAAQTSHEAFQELEERHIQLKATLELERSEYARRVQDLADEYAQQDKTSGENDIAHLMAALEPFANAGRTIPENATPKVFYVPGIHNARTFDLNDLKRAAQALFGEPEDPYRR